MTERTLRGCRVLLVEDEYMIADMLAEVLMSAGAIVLGPEGTIASAIARIHAESEIDGAILDVNLRGDYVFPVAELLLERGVPFVFTTGYDASIIPDRFEHIPRCEKPFKLDWVTKAIGRAIHT